MAWNLKDDSFGGISKYNGDSHHLLVRCTMHEDAEGILNIVRELFLRVHGTAGEGTRREREGGSSVGVYELGNVK